MRGFGIGRLRRQYFQKRVGLLEGRPEVFVEDLGHAFAPDLVAKDEAGPTVEFKRGARSETLFDGEDPE